MDYIHSLRPMIGSRKIILNCAGVLIEHQQKLLFQRRSDNGQWGLIGGLLEMNETYEEAALREVREETGLQIRLTSFLGIYHNHNMIWSNGDQAHVVSAYFTAEILQGEPRVDEESLELRWFAPEEAPEMFAEDHRAAMAAYLSGVRYPLLRENRYLPHAFLYARNLNRHSVDTARYGFSATAPVRRVQQMMVPGSRPTELLSLDRLAAELGVKAVYLKDESTRFGLKAFKGLGSLYAMFRILCRELQLDPDSVTPETLQHPSLRARIERMIFATTTDGNHGKGVSWAAKVFGCSARVFLPAGTVEARAEAIRQAGNAEAVITDMRYDDCVAWTAKQAEAHGWFLIQDTAWEGYEEIPEWIMQGYTTMVFEAAEQAGLKPTHLLLQAGVGSMAGAVAAAAHEAWGDVHVYTVEPTEAACFYASFVAADGRAHPAEGGGQTEMAGLNCAVPCQTAWTLLSALADGGFACDDAVTEEGIRYLHENSPSVTAGESGAVTAGLLLKLRECREPALFSPDSVLLIINTEGDTDPENVQRILHTGDGSLCSTLRFTP